jgi:hypothetical protein
MSPGRAQFQQELADVEQLTLGTLDLVLALLDRVIEALEHQDVELVPMVLADDARIDDRCAEVQQDVLSLLALQGPVAGDLRLLAALLHLVRYIERMGNQCVSVAKLIPLSGHEPPVRAEILRGVLTMGRCARAEVVQCRRARRGQPPQPRDLPAGDRGRRRRGHARVGDAHDARRARLRTRRRQRRRHRRADRVSRHRAVPGVHDSPAPCGRRAVKIR